jgi:hypothetical protein
MIRETRFFVKPSAFPFDSLDLKQSRDRKPREIRWDELDVARLPATSRAALGEEWRARMVQEHLAVGAFAEITSELASTGCDAVVLGLAARASSDEVRHADVCGRIAMAMLGAHAVPRRLRGVPVVPPHVGCSATERTLLHVVEMCCLSETLTGVYLTEMLARTTNLGMRSAIEFLLEDEIDHGRLGWAHLAACARDGRAGAIATALPAMLERVVGDVMRAGQAPTNSPPLTEGYGQIDARDAACIFATTLATVILPGFEATGIDLSAANGYLGDRRWLSLGQ